MELCAAMSMARLWRCGPVRGFTGRLAPRQVDKID
jgi:hypothetical protein